MTYRLPGGLRRQIRLKQQALIKSLIAIVQMILVYQVMNSNAGEFINNLQLKSFFDIRGRISAPEEIVIAALDENSYAEEKLSVLKSWPRGLLAEVLNNIEQAKAKLIVIDMRFDPNTQVAEADQAVIDALTKMPVSIAMFESTKTSINIDNKIVTTEEVEKPGENFAKAAKYVTPMMIVSDLDGTVRKFYFSKRYYLEGKTPIPLAIPTEDYLGQKLKALPELNDYLNLYGPSGSIRTVSINKLINKNITSEFKEKIRDKIIVIGTFRESKIDSTSEDQFSTNFGKIFGAEIHATTIANLIHQNWIKRLKPSLDFMIIISITILSSFLSISGGPLVGTVIALGSAAGIIIFSYVMFLNNYFLPCLVYCIGIVPLLIIGILSYHYFTTLRAFKQVEEALGVSLRPKK